MNIANKFLCVFVIAMAWSASVNAGVVFSNYGAGDSTHPTSWSFGDLAGGYTELGAGFTVAGGSQLLTSIDASIAFSKGVNSLSLSIYSVNSGLPSVLLETASATGLPTGSGSIASTNFAFAGTTLLESGKSYAVIASPLDDDDSQFAWRLNKTGDKSFLFRQDGGAWNSFANNVAAAYRVNGSFSPVPEPSAVAIWGLLLSVPILRSARHRAGREREWV